MSWRAWSKGEDESARAAALATFLEDDQGTLEEKRVLALSVKDALVQEMVDIELRTKLVRVAHKLSQDKVQSEPLQNGALIHKVAAFAGEEPFGTDLELQDYALRMVHNLFVMNRDLVTLADEDLMDVLLPILDDDGLIEKGYGGDPPSFALRCVLATSTVCLSQPWYRIAAKAKQQRVMDIATALVGKLVPARDAPMDSWEPPLESSVVLTLALHSIPEDMEGSQQLYIYAESAFLACKTSPTTLLSSGVTGPASLLTFCRVPSGAYFARMIEMAKKVSSLLKQSTERYIDAETRGPTKLAKEEDVNVESNQAPLWALALKFAEIDSSILREEMTPYFFKHGAEDAPEDAPGALTLPQWRVLMSSEVFFMLSYVVGQVFFHLGKGSVKLLLRRFGFELCAGVLSAIGAERLAQHESEISKRLDEPDEIYDRVPLVEDDISVEQFYKMVEIFGGPGGITMKNPVEQAAEEGKLEEVEQKMRDMELKKIQEEDEEDQRAVEEWAQLKMKRTAPKRDAPCDSAARMGRAWGAASVLGLAEAVLSHASLVREANVLCTRLGADAHFQLAVQRPFPCGLARSVHDSAAGMAASELDPGTHGHVVPVAVVRVVDRRTSAIHYWDLATLAEQVKVLHRIHSSLHNPGVAQHTDVYTQLFRGASHGFAHLGTARIPTFPLAEQSHGTWRVPIHSTHLGTLGHCRVSVMYVCTTKDGVVGRISVDELDGLTEREASEVHLQMHLDSFGTCGESADVYATRPVYLQAQSCAAVKLQRTITLPHRALHNAGAVHVLARPTLHLLDDWQERDAEKEEGMHRGADLVAALGAAPPTTQGRLHERKRRYVSSHGVRAEVHMLELDSCGKPRVAPRTSTNPPHFVVDASGVQCLAIALHHDSGAQLPWTGIRRVALGDVRCIDATGAVHATDESYCTLQRSSGSTGAALSVEALWRPEHELLQSPTPPAHHIRATLRVDVDVENSTPLPLSIPLYVRVHASGRLQRTADCDVTWNCAARPSDAAHHAFFCASLSPAPIQRPQELWRVDTRSAPVPGQGALKQWAPRGLSLVADYVNTMRRDAFAIRVCHTRSTLQDFFHARNHASLKAVVLTWQAAADPFHWSTLYSSDVHLVELHVCASQGPLAIQQDAHSQDWLDAWFELRPQKSEGILLSIYLHGVHVHPAALDSPHTLGLYTATNAYLLRAPSSTLAEQWRCVSRLTQCRPLVGARPTP